MYQMQKFICRSNFIKSQENFDILFYECLFDSSVFKNSLFQQLKIHFPDKIRLAVNIRKAEFLAGRFCAKKCLRELNIKDFEIKADNNRCPMWPPGLNGSITHSKSMAIAAVSSQSSVLGVGIDIEDIISSVTISETIEQVMYGREFSLFDTSDVSREVLFSLVFSIKESFFKAAYPSTGYYFGFDAVRINSLDFLKNRFELTLLQDLNPLLIKGYIYTGYFKLMHNQIFSILVIKN